jgi:hypothetical protein
VAAQQEQISSDLSSMSFGGAGVEEKKDDPYSGAMVTPNPMMMPQSQPVVVNQQS